MPSRARATSLELLAPLAASIITHWDRAHFDVLMLSIQPQNKYNDSQPAYAY